MSIINENNKVILKVYILPSSSKNQIIGIYNDRLKIKIAAAPEDNKANKELIKFLSKVFGIKKRDIKITQGEHSKDKTLAILETTIKEIKTKLGL